MMADWTPKDAIEEAQPEPNGHDRSKFQLVRFRDIKLGKERSYLVKGTRRFDCRLGAAEMWKDLLGI
jgi:hypothetical protein